MKVQQSELLAIWRFRMRDFTTNKDLMISAGPGDVVRLDGKELPPILAQAGAEAWRHVVEYFTAHIRNPNIRAAYGRAVISFFWWCEAHDRHSFTLAPARAGQSLPGSHNEHAGFPQLPDARPHGIGPMSYSLTAPIDEQVGTACSRLM